MNKLKTIDREALFLKIFIQNPKGQSFKAIRKNTIWIVDPFTQVKSAEHIAKFNTKSISNRGTFCNFSLAAKRKIYKTSMKHLKLHKFPFKNVILFLAIECKMYLKIQQKLHCLGCISKQTMSSVVKKTRLNSSKDDFLQLLTSFSSSPQRKLSILLNFLFPFFVF